MKRYIKSWLYTGVFVFIPTAVVLGIYFLSFILPFYVAILIVSFILNTLLAFDYDNFIKNRGDK